MARPKKNPGYDPDKIMKELLDVAVEEYKKSQKVTGGKGEIKSIAAELEIAPHKARKLLITAGIRDGEEYYSNARCGQILSLHREGKSMSEIMAVTGLNRTSVCCYLPYTKGLYNAKELSLDAERIRRYRSRQERCRTFMDRITFMEPEESQEYLWDTLVYLEGCIFRTSGRKCREGLLFRYRVRGGEMFIDRKEKSITKSTVTLAFSNALKLQQQNGCVPGPKSLKTFGSSYLYPIFLRLGICTESETEGIQNT